jgi:hypothetical protein
VLIGDLPRQRVRDATRSEDPIIAKRSRLIIRIAILAAIVAAASLASARFASLALAPPVLEPFDGKWHSDSFLVSGSVDSVRALSQVHIRRNGVVVDSASTSIRRTFSVRVTLVPGENQITAVLIDSTLQTSPPSNAIIVRFDDSAGLFIAVPMAPGAAFNLNAVNEARGAALRVFDMTGDLVVQFASTETKVLYSFPWDGLNASREAVRRGPLVAVGTIDYPDGTHEVIRRAFLFDPGASP